MANILKITTKPRIKFEANVSSKEIRKSFGRAEDFVELHITDVNDILIFSESDFIDYSFQENEEVNSPPSTIDYPTSVEPAILNPDGKGAGTIIRNRPGPRGEKNGYYFNNGVELIWVSEEQISTNNEQPQTTIIETRVLVVDPEKILNERGFSSGKYKLHFNFQRKKIFNLEFPPFNIKEISQTRREIRSIALGIDNTVFDSSVSGFISEIEGSLYFRDFVLNFGNNTNITGINLLLNKGQQKSELLIKTLEPLPSFIQLNQNFSIVESVIDPVSIEVDLGIPRALDKTVDLLGPNFKIDTRLNNSIPSSFKNYDEVLSYSVTSSYNNLINRLEKEEIPHIAYDYIRPISESLDESIRPFHFENFVHFGSALERLKNFEYKLNLLELYDQEIGTLNKVTGNTSSSFSIIENKESFKQKQQNLLKGFDGYERFLYYESGTYSWPKQNTSKPYILYSVTSSNALTWLGSEIDTSDFYGGQLLSASFFDNQNDYSLKTLIPNHILENPDNNFYVTFTHMIGHHFDQIWTHIKALTDINDTHHIRGVSKDLVYFTLKSLGIETFDQFENSNLIEYILGEGSSGSAFYNTPVSQSLVTASNEGSLPKGDVSKEVWKRLYHNAPYLLKTKGTERGIKALMSCYGIPSTILNVKEYGGPVKDKSSFKTFSYEKSGLALTTETVSNSASGYFVKTLWSSSLTHALTAKSNKAKTVEFRILPKRTAVDYHLFTLSGSCKGADLHPSSSSPLDTHLILNRYTGNDISSSGDSNDYGRLQLYVGDTLSGSTAYFPIFNGNFWNIHIAAEKNPAKVHKTTVQFGAYQSNHLKNVSRYITSSIVGVAKESGSYYDTCWGTEDNGSGSSQVYFGGVPANGYPSQSVVAPLGYSGSMQEIRYYFGEKLTDNTLTKHALDPFMYSGNTVSSSYNHLVLRLPLGSNCQENSASYHPNYNVDYLNAFRSFSNLLFPLNNDLGYVNTSSFSNTSFIISNPGNHHSSGESFNFENISSSYKAYRESSPGALDGNAFNISQFIGEKQIRFFSGTGSAGITAGLGEFDSSTNNRIGTAFNQFGGRRSVLLSPSGPTPNLTASLGLQFDWIFHGGKPISAITISSSKTPAGAYNQIAAEAPMVFDVSVTYDGVNYEIIDQVTSTPLTTGNWPEDCPSQTNPVTPSQAQQGYAAESTWRFTDEANDGTTNITDPRPFSRTAMAYYYGPKNSTFLDTGKDLGVVKGIRILFKETLSNHPNSPVIPGTIGPNEMNSKLQIENISFSVIDESTKTSGEIKSGINFKEIIETHHLPTPDTVGISTTSEKIRLDEGIIDDNILSVDKKAETSLLDRQPLDYEDLGVFFSPTNEINEDIVYTLGSFRLDDYIGSPLPSVQTSSNYEDLSSLGNLYFKKLERRFNYWDYIKLIQYTDHTLFKLVEQFVPMKANTKTGLLIEPHFLERNKFARQLPVIEDGQTMVEGSFTTINVDVKGETIDELYTLSNSSMGGGNIVTTNNLTLATGSNGKRKEQGTNFTINVSGLILDEPQNAAQAPIQPYSGSKPVGYIPHKSNVLLGNATKGRLSDKFFRSLNGGGKIIYSSSNVNTTTANSVNYITTSTSSISESFTVEFDDSLESLKGWFGVRYEGSKLTGKKINEYTKGDITYGLNPVVTRKTQAVYIANSVVGGREDKQFATIENHSYVGIQKILLIDKDKDTVEIIDRETLSFDPFHKFVTSDFPTGAKFNVKILDPSIQHNLKGNYHVKMNKGFLLSTFKYFDYSNNTIDNVTNTSSLNPLELFDNSTFKRDSANTFTGLDFKLNRLSFKFGSKNEENTGFPGASNTGNFAHSSAYPIDVNFGPSYVSASVVANKFTREYYSGSLQFPDVNEGPKGAFLSASRFLLNDTLGFLNENFQRTELHLTINRGTKTLAPGFNDERSIGTFEVDRSFKGLINDETEAAAAALPPGDFVGHDTPLYHMLQLKGGTPYLPSIPKTPVTSSYCLLFDLNNINQATLVEFARDSYLIGNENPHDSTNYSGSFGYELSFLDKDHTLISDIDKDSELFDGIGNDGVVLIPEHLDGTIKKNLEYYLEKAGLLDKATNLKA